MKAAVYHYQHTHLYGCLRVEGGKLAVEAAAFTTPSDLRYLESLLRWTWPGDSAEESILRLPSLLRNRITLIEDDAVPQPGFDDPGGGEYDEPAPAPVAAGAPPATP